MQDNQEADRLPIWKRTAIAHIGALDVEIDSAPAWRFGRGKEDVVIDGCPNFIDDFYREEVAMTGVPAFSPSQRFDDPR